MVSLLLRQKKEIRTDYVCSMQESIENLFNRKKQELRIGRSLENSVSYDVAKFMIGIGLSSKSLKNAFRVHPSSDSRYISATAKLNNGINIRLELTYGSSSTEDKVMIDVGPITFIAMAQKEYRYIGHKTAGEKAIRDEGIGHYQAMYKKFMEEARQLV